MAEEIEKNTINDASVTNGGANGANVDANVKTEQQHIEDAYKLAEQEYGDIGTDNATGFLIARGVKDPIGFVFYDEKGNLIRALRKRDGSLINTRTGETATYDPTKSNEFLQQGYENDARGTDTIGSMRFLNSDAREYRKQHGLKMFEMDEHFRKKFDEMKKNGFWDYNKIAPPTVTEDKTITNTNGTETTVNAGKINDFISQAANLAKDNDGKINSNYLQSKELQTLINTFAANNNIDLSKYIGTNAVKQDDWTGNQTMVGMLGLLKDLGLDNEQLKGFGLQKMMSGDILPLEYNDNWAGMFADQRKLELEKEAEARRNSRIQSFTGFGSLLGSIRDGIVANRGLKPYAVPLIENYRKEVDAKHDAIVQEHNARMEQLRKEHQEAMDKRQAWRLQQMMKNEDRNFQLYLANLGHQQKKELVDYEYRLGADDRERKNKIEEELLELKRRGLDADIALKLSGLNQSENQAFMFANGQLISMPKVKFEAIINKLTNSITSDNKSTIFTNWNRDFANIDWAKSTFNESDVIESLRILKESGSSKEDKVNQFTKILNSFGSYKAQQAFINYIMGDDKDTILKKYKEDFRIE